MSISLNQLAQAHDDLQRAIAVHGRVLLSTCVDVTDSNQAHSEFKVTAAKQGTVELQH